MRTTIDLPDELMRQAKARAALQGRKLKDLFEEWVRQGLREDGVTATPAPPRSPLPVIPKAAGGPVPALTNAELNTILDEEDVERVVRLAGR
jgi:hypothetical protein